MATVCKPGRALPEYVVMQQELLEALRVRHRGLDQLEMKLRLASHTTVEQRYFVAPLQEILTHSGVASRAQCYIREVTSLALAAIRQTSA